MPEGLQKKLGPLPVWAWAVVVVGAYLVYRYIHSHQGQAAAAGASTGSVSTGQASSGLAYDPSTGAIYDPNSGTIYGTMPQSSGNNGTGSVSDWLTSAVNALQSLGYTPDQYQPALQDYLAGNPLTQTEAAIVHAAGSVVGTAPGLPLPTATITANMQPQAAGPTPASAFAAEGNAFGSYPGAIVTDITGAQFYPLTPVEAQGIVNQGGTTYYFPNPSAPAQPTTGVPFTQPTPLYGKVTTAAA